MKQLLLSMYIKQRQGRKEFINKLTEGEKETYPFKCFSGV